MISVKLPCYHFCYRSFVSLDCRFFRLEHFGFFKFNLMNKSLCDKGWINRHSKWKVFYIFCLVINLRNHTSLFLKLFFPLLRLRSGHLAVTASVYTRHWKVITRPNTNSIVLNLLYMVVHRPHSLNQKIEPVLLAWFGAQTIHLFKSPIGS